ncbi:hypothetical protein JW979_02840 [bacterium]|nr:hypothetical protein [candidate division CSSED10-310 bacterium]
MALQKSEKRTLMIGGAVLAIGLVYILATSNKDDAKPGKTPKAAVSKIAKPLASITGSEKKDKKEEVAEIHQVQYASWGRDPFLDRKKAASAQVWKEQEEIKNLVLKGIIRMGNKSYVMINDVILTVGQEKDGIYVESIEGNLVTCRRSGKTFTLEWKESS